MYVHVCIIDYSSYGVNDNALHINNNNNENIRSYQLRILNIYKYALWVDVMNIYFFINTGILSRKMEKLLQDNIILKWAMD